MILRLTTNDLRTSPDGCYVWSLPRGTSRPSCRGENFLLCTSFTADFLLLLSCSSSQVKLGGVAAVGGSILGYAGASVVREQRDLRTYIDEHYVREPDLYVLSPKEEAELSRRLDRSASVGPEPSSRHLPPSRPGSRRGPGGYRRPSTVSCSSAASSIAARRRAESFRSREVIAAIPPQFNLITPREKVGGTQ